MTPIPNWPVDSLEKGVPYGTGDASRRRWNLLGGDLQFPLLVLKESALAANIRNMAEWCRANGFLLAPHGKTTMCPAIWQRQIDAGAWGITVAHANQAAVAVRAGVSRVLIANQITGAAAARSVACAISEVAGLEVYCLADRVESVGQLGVNLRAARPSRPVYVLVEWGRPHWRTGARSIEQAVRVFQEIARYPDVLHCAGVEGFEGLSHAESSADAAGEVGDFLKGAIRLAETIESRLNGADLPLFSIGGSAFLDMVREAGAELAGRFRIVVRSGCYVTHDHGTYQARVSQALERAGGATLPRFTPALELWSLVQSLPDPGVAILTFGKRDCSYDAGLPAPLFAMPRRRTLDGCRIVALNDQHAYLSGDTGGLSVGDLVCCGISHPCTAFDKWRVIPVVNDDYDVLDWYRTYF